MKRLLIEGLLNHGEDETQGISHRSVELAEKTPRLPRHGSIEQRNMQQTA